MDWYSLGGRCKVIPQVFYKLELLRWAQIKDGDRCWVHLSHSCNSEKKCSDHCLDCTKLLLWAEAPLSPHLSGWLFTCRCARGTDALQQHGGRFVIRGLGH